MSVSALAEAGADAFASAPVQWILAVLSALTVALLTTIARSLWKLTLTVDRIHTVVFPEDEPDLGRQIRTIRQNGSDRLQEIVDEARETRTEATRQIAEVREIAERIEARGPRR